MRKSTTSGVLRKTLTYDRPKARSGAIGDTRIAGQHRADHRGEQPRHDEQPQRDEKAVQQPVDQLGQVVRHVERVLPRHVAGGTG